jgi:hypothetical protein
MGTPKLWKRLLTCKPSSEEFHNSTLVGLPDQPGKVEQARLK